MEVSVFIDNLKRAFGETHRLPFAFWHSDEPVDGCSEKINGCIFKELGRLMAGRPVALSADRIGCMGGRFYTGFAAMDEKIPAFVSCKEKYKQSPEMVLDFLEKAEVRLTAMRYLNISPVDRLDGFDGVEGIFFLATPDVLAGLAAWTFYDNNADDAITAKFGSGCSVMFTETLSENRRNGKRTFLGLFDPSVRKYLEEDILGFAIPMSRFREMYATMHDTCLFDTPAWGKIRERICR